jgi:uncharacterized protein (DUF111 family)
MAKTPDVDKAKRILPTNATPGVAELNSNFSVYIAPVNPETAGEDCTPVDCGSISEVAAKFAPKLEFEVKKVENLGADAVDQSTASVTMRYGEDPSQIMSDFQADNLAVKAKSAEGERILLDQQLTHLALDDLMERMKDQKLAQLLQSNKEGVVKALEAEIERLQQILEEQKLQSLEE